MQDVRQGLLGPENGQQLADQGTSDTQSRKAGTQSTRKAKDWTRKMDRALMMNVVTYHPVWPSISKV